MTDRIEELERLLKAATPGPWVPCGAWIDGGENGCTEVLAPAPVDCATYCLGGRSRIELSEADRKSIIAAHNALPDLIALAKLAEELASEFENELLGTYGHMLTYPSQRAKFENEMEPVRQAREILARLRGKP